MKRTFISFTILFAFLSTHVFSQSLVSAAIKNDTVTLLSLIKSGGKVNESDADGSSPLIVACRWGNIGSVKLLLNNGATANEPRTKTGRTALIVGCAYYSGITVVKMLIEKGADVNAKAQNGTTALMLAAKAAKSDVIEYLLAHGADAKAKDNDGRTALDYANNAFVMDHLADTRIDKNDCIVRLTRAMGK